MTLPTSGVWMRERVAERGSVLGSTPATSAQGVRPSDSRSSRRATCCTATSGSSPCVSRPTRSTTRTSQGGETESPRAARRHDAADGTDIGLMPARVGGPECGARGRPCPGHGGTDARLYCPRSVHGHGAGPTPCPTTKRLRARATSAPARYLAFHRIGIVHRSRWVGRRAFARGGCRLTAGWLHGSCRGRRAHLINTNRR